MHILGQLGHTTADRAERILEEAGGVLLSILILLLWHAIAFTFVLVFVVVPVWSCLPWIGHC